MSGGVKGAGVLAARKMTAKTNNGKGKQGRGQLQGPEQRQKQIPCGDDNQ
jgi:hypothetical protein